ncbi:MAG: PhzF family phenazine biosynthesis protein [Rhodospirillales bacterium]|nr:PhzF family phenazine biosynthesis protein [Rhodospirillales bacterium]
MTRGDACALHCRDLCPSLGVNESSAVSTRNVALAACLVRHGVIAGGGLHSLEAEQGLAVGRPGRVHLEIEAADTRARAIHVGGMVTRMIITDSIPRPS